MIDMQMSPVTPEVAHAIMHPHMLHGIAALHSLNRAWLALQRARRAVARTSADDADRGTLQAWRPGSGVSGGPGVGAGIDTATLEAPDTRAAELRHLAEVHERCLGDAWQARWLAVSDLGETAGGNVLTQILRALPRVAPATARDIASWLTTADRRIRRVLKLEPDHLIMPGNPECPVCTVRMLRIQASGLDPADWTVVCTVPCRCSGEGCPCRMPIKERNALHIWQASVSGRIAA